MIPGPTTEWYRETAGTVPASFEAAAAARAATIARLQALEFASALAAFYSWRCQTCGAPRIVPDLAATLAYDCNFAELPAGGWLHYRRAISPLQSLDSPGLM